MKKIYSIWDSKAEEFAPPFVAKNDKIASRMFIQSIRNLPYADDMKLYYLGNFNPDSINDPICVSDLEIPAKVVPIEVTTSE